MRLIKVSAPEGKGEEIARLAFEAGIRQVTVQQVEVLASDGSRQKKDTVDAKTSTPAAKAFADAVLAAPFFDPEEYSVEMRQPRSVVSGEDAARLTWPVATPTVDILEELWQFSHVTWSFVGRMFIGGVLLAYGMMKFNLLMMIAGLMFLPMLPLVLAVGFGALTGVWRLALQGLAGLAVSTALVVAAGAAVAALQGPPLRFQEFSPLGVAALISVAVGVAAGLATGDDVGRREMIGLAATAQMALLPAWLGVSLVIGFSSLDLTPPSRRILTFFVNVGSIAAASLVTYAILGMRGAAVRRFAGGTRR